MPAVSTLLRALAEAISAERTFAAATLRVGRAERILEAAALAALTIEIGAAIGLRFARLPIRPARLATAVAAIVRAALPGRLARCALRLATEVVDARVLVAERETVAAAFAGGAARRIRRPRLATGQRLATAVLPLAFGQVAVLAKPADAVALAALLVRRTRRADRAAGEAAGFDVAIGLGWTIGVFAALAAADPRTTVGFAPLANLAEQGRAVAQASLRFGAVDADAFALTRIAAPLGAGIVKRIAGNGLVMAMLG
jgi:hypothetical protein